MVIRRIVTAFLWSVSSTPRIMNAKTALTTTHSSPQRVMRFAQEGLVRRKRPALVCSRAPVDRPADERPGLFPEQIHRSRSWRLAGIARGQTGDRLQSRPTRPYPDT